MLRNAGLLKLYWIWVRLNMNENALVLIDGAGSGIGKATALNLNASGTKIVAVGRNVEKLLCVKKECRFPDLFFCETKDIGEDVSSLPEWVKELVGKYGAFSGYVHAAGVLNPQPLKVLDHADMIRDFNINLFSALFIIKELARKKNRQERLDIVCVSSIAAKIGNPGSSTYGMTKAAINNMVSSIAQEIGGKSIRINAVCPGGTKTAMAERYNENLPYDYLEKCRERNVFHEDGKPKYIADVIAFLLSDQSYWIQGQCLTVDGGETLS